MNIDRSFLLALCLLILFFTILVPLMLDLIASFFWMLASLWRKIRRQP